MKRYKHIVAMLLSMLVCVLLLPFPVSAAGKIELEREISLNISYQDAGIPLTGARFDIYLVAETDEYGELAVTQPFQAYEKSILRANDADAWNALASTLEGYVDWKAISSTDSGATDRQGMLSFPNREPALKAGLYLVLGGHCTQNGNRYDATPFLVLLPSLDWETNDWIYDVTVQPKHNYERIDDTEDDTVTRKVLKVWEDNGCKQNRPSKITVHLFCDGKLYDTVTLSASGSWRYTWDDLESGHWWTLAEEAVDGYTPEVQRNGSTFVITNTYDGNPPVTPSRPQLPHSGQLWWPVPVLAACGLLLIVLGLLRHRNKQ